MTPTLDAAQLYSSRAGSDLGRTLDWLRTREGEIIDVDNSGSLAAKTLKMTVSTSVWLAQHPNAG